VTDVVGELKGPGTYVYGSCAKALVALSPSTFTLHDRSGRRPLLRVAAFGQCVLLYAIPSGNSGGLVSTSQVRLTATTDFRLTASALLVRKAGVQSPCWRPHWTAS